MNMVKQIFEQHYNYYGELGIETIKQQAGQVEQVSADYQGRVIYELLQNAFDKATNKILVSVRSNSLLIANDGTKFTYSESYSYQNGGNIRGDFQALSSISTSNKLANVNIGNKGVGFKSVYSIAQNGCVNIYTKGIIISESEKTPQEICFQLFDSFKDDTRVPECINKDLRETIKRQIKSVQLERKERGVPGFYYPILLSEKSEHIEDLFNQGYVTIIEIPFNDYQLDIKPLINEIKGIHFHFVQLKYDSDLTIHFDLPNDSFDKQVRCLNEHEVISVPLKDSIKLLATNAGIQIENPKIALIIKQRGINSQSYLYNYLPTKLKSPFKYVDFHADFHTTVDRKSINFDGAIGQYNRALFQACIELYFLYIKSYIGSSSKSNLKFQYIDDKKFSTVLSDFDWRILDFENSDRTYSIVRPILNIRHGSYDVACHFLREIAEKYFLTNKDKEYTHFYESTLKFIKGYSRTWGDLTSLTKDFMKAYADVLRQSDAKIIPTNNEAVSLKEEVFYREKIGNNRSIVLPTQLAIKITEFKIDEKEFRQFLGIKEFNDNNELLKHFKQATETGEVSSASITETEQKTILNSLLEIYRNKHDTFKSSAHRFIKVFSDNDRRSSSTLNLAMFNISTIFLKTVNGLFKPAQLCRKNELDLSFLGNSLVGIELDSFLMFLGASLDNTYVFADARVFQNLGEGLNRIPALLDNTDSKMKWDDVLRNIFFINSKGVSTHPALINDNHYYFLKELRTNNVKDDFETLLIKKYDQFPKPFAEVLFNEIESCPNGIERLYPRIFSLFNRHLDKCLVSLKKRLSWRNSKEIFYIAENRDAFDKLSNQNIPLLSYIDSYYLPEPLINRKITLIEGEIVSVDPKDITSLEIERIQQRMIYLLAAISASGLSESDYKSESSKLHELHQVILVLKIYSCSKLSRQINCKGVDLVFEDDYDAVVDKEKNEIYFSETCGTKKKAEAISKFLFNNTRIVSQIEIILYFKDIAALENEFAKEELDLFKKLWVKDYKEKFRLFQLEILSNCGVYELIDSQWYIYSAMHRSEFLLDNYRNGNLNNLKGVIDHAKVKYNGLFDDFYLSIDYNLNYDKIGKLIVILKSINDEWAINCITELEALSQTIGRETEIDEIESTIQRKYDNHSNAQPKLTDIKDEKNRLEFQRKVDSIYNMINDSTHTTLEISFSGSSVQKEIPINSKKIIFQGVMHESSHLQMTGASGEEIVLGYFIKEFMKLSKLERTQAIEDVFSVIQKRLGSNIHGSYKNICLKEVDNNENLSKALIPFFYISLNYKYAYLDMVCYKNGRPIIIEVKTTNSTTNNSFYISTAEINEARRSTNYEIVRVTPNEIIFMGNPIKLVENKLTTIDGLNFKLTPLNYRFEFIEEAEGHIKEM